MGDFLRQGYDDVAGELGVVAFFCFLDAVPEGIPIGQGGWRTGRGRTVEKMTSFLLL